MTVQRKTVTINYTPRPQFMPFHDRAQRWAILVAHRRAGKTVACINDTVALALKARLPEPRYGYFAPYFSQVKDIAWSYLKQYAWPLLKDEPNESELRVDLINGARIRLYGTDNPDRLRGIYLDGAVLDEPEDMHPDVWPEVIRPALTDRQGWATFIGTPKGKGAFYRQWIEAQKNPEWFAQMLKASETGLIPQEELDAARAEMGRDLYMQEFECSFDAAIKGAFYADELERAQEDKRIGRVPIERALKVHTAWDLGVSDSTAIWFVQVVGKERRLIDYYETSGVGLDHYAKVLADKGYVYGDHYFPHDIQVRELGTGASRVETLQGLGIAATVVPQASVMDGINAVRRMLDSTWIDTERCGRGLEALKQYRREWDDKLRDWRARPRHGWESHGADALRTFAMGFEDRKPAKPISLRRAKVSPQSWMGA